MDVYIGISLPSNIFYVLDSNGIFQPISSNSIPAYKIGVKKKEFHRILTQVPICSSSRNQIPAGTYKIYVLAIPTNGGNFKEIDFNKDPYYLYFYNFNIPSCLH